MKNNFLKFGLMAFFMLSYALPTFAQPGGGGGGTDDESEYAAPVDNWVLFLVLAGIAVAAYFIMKNSRKAIA